MSNPVNESSSTVLSDVDIHDRVMEAYYGKLGETFMYETQERIHWICSNVVGNKVMDIGCSQGIVPILLAREGCEIIGVDTSPKAIEEAQHYLNNEPEHVRKNVTYINEDFVSLDVEHYQVDTLVLSEVLEHLVRPEVFVKKASDILKKTEGTLVVTVPFGINAFIDHKSTFYLIEPYLILAKYFGEVEHFILGKWIGFVAKKPGQQKQIDNDIENFVGSLEQGFYNLEKKLRDGLSRQSAQLASLKEKHSVISAALSDAKEKYRIKSQEFTELKERNATLRDASQKTDQELKIVQSENEELKEKINALEKTQKSLSEQLNTANSETELLLNKINRAEAEKEQLHSEINFLRNDLTKELSISNDKRNGHYQKLVTTREDVKKKNAEIRSLENKLNAVYDSAAYQVGTHLKRATTLKGFIKLPFNLYKVYQSASNRKKNVRTVVSSTVVQNTVALKIKTEKTEDLFTLTQAELLSVEGWPELSDNGKPKVLAVMDEFTTGCFEHDLNLITPRPDNWKALAKKYSPELFFIESAWKGNEGSWQYRVGNYSNKPGNEVEEMTRFAKLRGVPSVFWNKEDPVHHEKFMCSAKLVDYIFTTDANKINSYKKKTGNPNVYALPFAAQPAIHKPASLTNRISKSCFAGSWYGNRHAERGEAMAWLLKVANKHGLDIFDRNYGTGNFPFPDEFNESIKGSLPYKELCAEYSHYRIFLNVNSVTDSPTMFSRRVFELLASGTPVVSTYAKGIEELFGSDIVWLVQSEEEANEAIHTLMTDDVEWRRRSLAGIRKVFSEHTYAHRLNEMFSIIGSEIKLNINPTVILIAKVNSEQEMSKAVEFSKDQLYENHKLFIESSIDFSNNDYDNDRIEVVNSGALKVRLQELGEDVLVGMLDIKAEYLSSYLTDLVAATMYENNAAGWGISATDKCFVYAGDTTLDTSIWRVAEFINSFADVETETERVVSHTQLYCIDSDQFQRG